jgi:hypothetical protein
MEPTNLKPTPPDDAALEAWLRANAALPVLPDDGFSRRVLTALPETVQRAHAKRQLVCLGGALMGSAVAWLGMQHPGSPPPDLTTLDTALTEAFTQLANPAVGWALALAAASLLFAFRRELRPLVKS